jgi:hypothetical protein
LLGDEENRYITVIRNLARSADACRRETAVGDQQFRATDGIRRVPVNLYRGALGLIETRVLMGAITGVVLILTHFLDELAPLLKRGLDLRRQTAVRTRNIGRESSHEKSPRLCAPMLFAGRKSHPLCCVSE